jgi:mono/diheme cytochrome c family protein
MNSRLKNPVSRSAAFARPSRSWLASAAALLVLGGAALSVRAETDREYCERQQGFARDVCLRDLDKPAAKPSPAGASTAPVAAATKPAATAATAAVAAAAKPTATSAGLYKVVDGDKVDPETLKGFRAWRAAACDRCHGANQEGLVGPSLVNSLKTLTKEEFVTTVKNGRLEKGMQSFGNSPAVMDNINQLYAYLKGRSDGAIKKAHVTAIQ